MSIFKKTKSLMEHGLKPLEIGMHNYTHPNPVMESTATQRSKVCRTGECGNYVEEPIDFLKVEDDRIPSLSEKMCDECGCSLPYLLRQNIKICKHWKA